MNVYKIYEAGSDEKYAFAGGYGPVADLWFLKPAFLAGKRAFWKINPQLPGARIETEGRTWPDYWVVETLRRRFLRVRGW